MPENLRTAIVVAGSSNTDMVVRTPHLPRPGETVLGGEFLMNAGGKGANQAVAVSKLGGNLTFIAKVGDDVFGRQTCAQLQAQGISTNYISVSPDKASGVALINVDDNGENCIAVASGANSTLSATDIDAAESAIANARIMLLQLEIPIATVRHAAEVAKRYGVTVVLNPAPAPAAPLPAELLHNVDILIPNRTEMEAIAGVPEGTSPEKATAIICESGVGTVVVTLGSAGALICTDGKCVEVPSFKVTPVDTTAAGDTFCGAFCVALAEGKDISTAATLGCLAASVTVTRPGAQQAIPTRDEVSALAIAKGLDI